MRLSADYRRELRRKLFHTLSLIYLAFYHLFGAGIFLWALSAFMVFEGTVEFVRLRNPVFNDRLLATFGGIHREVEKTKVSGVFWSSLGCLLTVALFGANPEIVTAAFLYLALGDAVAALAGKAFGKITFKIGGRKKTLEGSLACFSVCLIAGWAAGLSLPAIGVGAVVATIVEILPVPLDDNLWIPLASAAAVSLL